MTDLKNKRVALLGFGVENQGVLPWLRQQGAEITVCDKNPNLQQTEQDVTYQLGENYLHDLTHFDMLVRTPGIPYLTPEIQAAKQAGVIVTSQIKLFLAWCQGRTIGITGTKGKGTTSSLIYSCLQAAEQAGELSGTVYLAGNIGVSAMSLLDKITADDWVVLELSSFQLQDADISPHIAVVLTTTSDHLDHHHSIAEYVAAKQNIVSHQTSEDYVIVHHDDPVSRSFLDHTHATPLFYSRQHAVDEGSWVENNHIMAQLPGRQTETICAVKDIQLVGAFNLENITAAVAASGVTGISIASIGKGITSFRGLPHRLELVGEHNEERYYNDSFATNPASTMAALESFAEPIILILGGSPKGIDYTELVQAIKESTVTDVICIGEEGPKLKQMLQGIHAPQQLHDGATTMTEIVAQAHSLANPGSVVLLSPATASFGMFKDYKDRGNQFKTAVEHL